MAGRQHWNDSKLKLFSFSCCWCYSHSNMPISLYQGLQLQLLFMVNSEVDLGLFTDSYYVKNMH